MAQKFSGLTPIPNVLGEVGIPAVWNGGNYLLTITQLWGTFTKDRVGLGNVDNTSDAQKPVSALVAAALAQKADLVHTHTPEQIQGLTQLLAALAPLEHTHTPEQIVGLLELLAGKADSVHQHQLEDIIGLAEALAQKVGVGTQLPISDVNGLSEAIQAIWVELSTKAPNSHGHAMSEIQGLAQALAEKSNVGHTHQVSEISGLNEAIGTVVAQAIEDAQLEAPSVETGAEDW